jgi:TPR repeat protein
LAIYQLVGYLPEDVYIFDPWDANMRNLRTGSVLVTLALLFSLLAGSGVAWSQDYRDGMVAFSHGKYKKAIQIWTSLAEKGDAVAQHTLGQVHMQDLKGGIKADYKKARLWLEQCEPLLMRCKKNLADIYFRGHGTKKDPERAAALYHQVIGNTVTDWPEGVNDALLNLGLLHYTGALGQERKGEARQWFRLAANERVPMAQFWLGSTYEASKSPEDLIEAVKWFTLAMRGDDSVARAIAMVTSKRTEEKMTWNEIETAHLLAATWRPEPKSAISAGK